MVVAERIYEDIYKQHNRVNYKPYNKNKNKSSKKNKKLSKSTKSLGFAAIAFIIGFIIVLRYATLTEMTSTIDKQKKYISSLDKTNSQIKAEMMIDLKTVDEVAKGKLGMDKPFRYQIVYVDLNKTDNEDMVSNSDSKKSNFQIAKVFSKMVEYLY